MQAAVIGSGAAGLMAAEVLITGGTRVGAYHAMPSPGRKFPMAGKGSLILTHSNPSKSPPSRSTGTSAERSARTHAKIGSLRE